jgi:hypothetical protein
MSLERRNRLCVSHDNEQLHDFLELLMEHGFGPNALHKIDYAGTFNDLLKRLYHWKSLADKTTMLEITMRETKALDNVRRIVEEELNNKSSNQSAKELALSICELLRMKGTLRP